ncbi:hypothetical protein [Salimicrobium flavidum]|uniref:Uncharacterized protein n=1 Tax=Salimicrobium flavidum TaxID=570947 RepID=A0A1N7JFL6_9BACI|nr:hypothetical protein [Salimicrobium flavidum]SIS48145.1 hypothetical protein SAMN05421687_105224 [Salimicrobium flavidum]
MAMVIMTIIIILIIVVAFKFSFKSKPSKGEDYTPASDMYSGKTKDYSTQAPQETHRKSPYEEVDRQQ